MNHPVVRLLLRWLASAAGVAVAAWVVPGIRYESGTALVLAVVVLSLFNAFLRPLLVLFTLPLVVLSLGLGLVLINALLLYLAGQLIPGFTVTGFWAAVFGAAIISVVSFLLLAAVRLRLVQVQAGPGGPGPRPPGRRDPDVIDI